MLILRDEASRFKLSTVKDRLVKADVPWLIFAGAAAYCYGSKREITDFDILVKSADLEKVTSDLKSIEGVDVVADLEIRTNQGICHFFMDDEMIERTRWKQLFGITVPVIPVEDNILFKAILQRGEAQGKRDIEDIQQMVANEKLDLEYLESRIQGYRAEKRVRPLLKRLGIL